MCPIAEPLILSLFLVAAIFCLFWLVYRQTDRLAVIDLFWAPGFVVIALVHVVYAPLTQAKLVFLGLLVLWATRLTWYLADRLLSHEHDDPRYQRMKDQGGAPFRTSSLWKVFLLQAVIQWVLAVPVHVVMLSQVSNGVSVFWVSITVLVALIGLTIETIADFQMRRFQRIKRDAPKGAAPQLLDRGLWAWSRHPNHFGEAVFWFGLAGLATVITGQWWCVLGPILLTAVMVKLSGVAMVDRHMSETRADFETYRSKTSAFVLWPPKRS